MVIATRFVASSLNKVWVSVAACTNPNLRPRSAELTPPLEIMVCNHAVRNLVREGKIFQISGIMQTARGEGMVTMNSSVEELVSSGKINYDDVELRD